MTDAEVADEVLRTADFLVMSGGGVTLSGGEPLAQTDFAAAIIDRIRAKEPRLTYAIETSGFASIADYRKVVQRLDFVYQDIKFPDLDGYRRWTGVDAAPIFENIKWLRKSMRRKSLSQKMLKRKSQSLLKL
jgi:pyruvate formate lyase activating enzyme